MSIFSAKKISVFKDRQLVAKKLDPRSGKEATVTTRSDGGKVLNTKGGNDNVQVKQHADGSGTVTVNGEKFEFTAEEMQNLTIDGGNGNDTINSRGGIDMVSGDRGKDTIESSSAQASGESRTPSNTVPNGGRKDLLLQALDSRSRDSALSQGGQNSTESSSEQTSEGTASEGTNAVNSAITNDTAGLEAAKEAMKNNLTQQASDPKAFHDIMKKSFGGTYDKAKAETIRKQVLSGDFSWMPEIKVVDQSTLQDKSGQQTGTALGAYSKENDTIYISRELLASDPAKAAQILTEEVGHGLDARLNTSDAAGDEGDIFSRLVGGESISDSELTNLKAENDSGSITVDGKEVEVEYGLFSGLKKAAKKLGKKIKNAVKGAVTTLVPGGKQLWKAASKVGKKIYDIHKKAWRSVEKGFKKVMQSKLFGQIMMVAQFIPIPIVALVVKGINVVRSAYSVYQGIKHGSAAAVLGGIAGVAGGVGGMGKMLGASSKFVNTANAISKGATAAGQGYAALAKGDMRAAAGFAKNYFGGASSIGQAIGTAQNIDSAIQKGEDGDWLGAIKSAKGAYSDIKGGNDAKGAPESKAGATGTPKHGSQTGGPAKAETGIKGWVEKIKSSKTYQAISENVSTIRSVVKAAKNGEYGKASTEFLENYGDDLGLSKDTQGSINKWATVIENVDAASDLVKNGEYSPAISRAAAALGIPLNTKNQQRLDSAFSIRDAVLKDKHADAARHASSLALQTGDEKTAKVFSQLADLLEMRDYVEKEPESVPQMVSAA